MKTPTERDFRLPEFADAKIEEYEFRGDGKLVRKDRWEKAIYRLAGITGLNRHHFEIDEVLQAVIDLEVKANPRYICQNPDCGHEGKLADVPTSVVQLRLLLLCPECKFPIGETP